MTACLAHGNIRRSSKYIASFIYYLAPQLYPANASSKWQRQALENTALK